MIDIVSIGECMIEFYSDSHLGKSIYVQGFGGDTLNVIVTAARLGLSVAYLTKIGTDYFSKILVNSWITENIDISQIKRDMGSFSGIYFIYLDDNGERTFQYYRKGSAASKLTPEDFNISFISTASIFYSSGITQALSESNQFTVKELFRNFKAYNQNSKIIAYDPNYREKLWESGIENAIKAQEEVLPYIDLIFPSFPSDAILCDAKSPEEMIHYYTTSGIKIVIVKLGARGAIFTEDFGKNIQKIPSFTASKIVDTTGAGDAFNGGVLTGIINKYSIKNAIKLGTVVSGLKISGRGAIPSLPTLSEVNEYWDK